MARYGLMRGIVVSRAKSIINTVAAVNFVFPPGAGGAYHVRFARNAPIAVFSTAGPRVFDVTNGTVTQRTVDTNTGIQNRQTNGVTLSPDGTYMMCFPYYTNGYAYVYKWNGSQYAYLATINDSSGSGYPTCLDFNEAGDRIVTTVWSEVRVYARTGDSFTLQSTYSTNISAPENVRWSHDGTNIAVFSRSSRVQFFAVSTGGTLTLLKDDVNYGAWDGEWSADDSHIACGNIAVGSGVYIWKRTGSGASASFTKIAGDLWTVNVSTPAYATISGIEYLILFRYQNIEMKVFKRVGDTYTEVTASSIGMTVASYSDWGAASVKIAATGKTYVLSGKSQTPYAQLWIVS